MQSNGKRVTVFIDGQPHALVTDEDPEHLKMVATIVDKKLKKLRSKFPQLDQKRLCMLALLEITSEQMKENR
ncbi:MAG: cell division protein ZapA [Bacilli bacterium]